MRYEDENGKITNFDLEILERKGEPFALVLTGQDKQTEISRDLAIKAATNTADLFSFHKGTMTVFSEKENGNFNEMSVEITTPHRNPMAQVRGESSEVSKNMVELFRENSEQITQSFQPKAESDSSFQQLEKKNDGLREEYSEQKEQLEPKNHDEILKKR